MSLKDRDPGKRALSRVQLYQRVFNTAQGQKVLYDLMTHHGILSSNYKSSNNPNDLFVLEGERNVVLRLLKILKTDPATLMERIAQYEHDQT